MSNKQKKPKTQKDQAIRNTGEERRYITGQTESGSGHKDGQKGCLPPSKLRDNTSGDVDNEEEKQ